MIKSAYPLLTSIPKHVEPFGDGVLRDRSEHRGTHGSAELRMRMAEHNHTAYIRCGVMDHLEVLTIGGCYRERCHSVENQMAVAARITSPAASEARMR